MQKTEFDQFGAEISPKNFSRKSILPYLAKGKENLAGRARGQTNFTLAGKDKKENKMENIFLLVVQNKGVRSLGSGSPGTWILCTHPWGKWIKETKFSDLSCQHNKKQGTGTVSIGSSDLPIDLAGMEDKQLLRIFHCKCFLLCERS